MLGLTSKLKKNKKVKKHHSKADHTKSSAVEKAKKVSGVQTQTVSTYGKKKECHTDPCEITKNLWIGSCWSVTDMTKNCSVIVPLSDSDGDIWDTWRGELLYVPITDYRALPIDVLTAFAMIVVEKLQKGETVGIHCMGGHGRTGYFVSAVLWLLEVPQLLGYPDPVKFIREKYCKKAIESDRQLQSLSVFTGIDGLDKIYEESKPRVTGNYWKYGSYSDSYWDDWVRQRVNQTYYDEQDDIVQESIVAHPCYACLHAYEIKVKGGYELDCELQNNMESRCVEYFPWHEYDDAVEKDSEVIEGEVVGECKGTSTKSVTIKY